MQFTYGIRVPKNYTGDVAAFCENCKIPVHRWTAHEFNFHTEENQLRVGKFIERKKFLDRNFPDDDKKWGRR